MSVVLIFFVVLLCLILFLDWKKNRHKDVEPPRYGGELPLLGHAHKFLTSPSGLINIMKEVSYAALDVGGVLSMTLGPRVMYVVSDPDVAYKVANEHLNKGMLYDFMKPWLGHGIFTAPAEIWKPNRKLLNPSFNTIALMNYLGVFDKQARELVRMFSDYAGNGPFDQSHYLCHLGLATLGLTSLGVDFGDHSRSDKYFTACSNFLDTVVQRYSSVWYHSPVLFKWSKLKKDQDKYAKEIHDITNGILRNKLQNTLANNPDKNFKTFMDILLELNETGQSKFTNNHMRDELDTIMLAGSDTSAHTLSFALQLIGSHPEVQEKMLEEINGIFGNSDRDICKEDINNLVYMDAVLKETMRIYPIAPIIFRVLDSDCKIKNYTLHAGNTVAISLYGLHRHPDWGPDREEFKPERWLNPDSLPKNPLLFAVFSFGKRSCIGRVYAMLYMKAVLTHLLRNFKVKADMSKLVLCFHLVMRGESGHHISLEKRMLNDVKENK